MGKGGPSMCVCGYVYFQKMLRYYSEKHAQQTVTVVSGDQMEKKKCSVEGK